jgi:prepilin-type N-terminal cleavage/methylation domain-containing protein/prepilin-type processing-associated H-X9-DG protein
VKSPHNSAYRNGNRFGLTLIEMLVVIGIVATLAGLILPAVQASRETARRAHCAKNLGQLIRATHSFAATWGGFPGASTLHFRKLPSGRSTLVGIFSTQCRLLPYLEQLAIYNSINFESHVGGLPNLGDFEGTAAKQIVDVFLCPSDPIQTAAPYAPNSYRVNIGVEQTRVQNNVHIGINTSGAFAFATSSLPLAEISDGLSNTLAFSEKPIGPGGTFSYSPTRDWLSVLPILARTADQWVSRCSTLSAPTSPQLDAGCTWFLPGAAYTAFIASVPPNSLIPDCGSLHNFGDGIFAARSYHPGGCNAALADGAVRWFSSATEMQFWRSLATRRGDEVISY